MTVAELERVARTRRLAVGDRVRVAGLAGSFLVGDQADSATLGLRTDRGTALRVGRLVVEIEDDA